jgi:hypothetical protein
MIGCALGSSSIGAGGGSECGNVGTPTRSPEVWLKQRGAPPVPEPWPAAAHIGVAGVRQSRSQEEARASGVPRQGQELVQLSPLAPPRLDRPLEGRLALRQD